MRQLIERLGVASAIDAGVRVLRRCKWYRESDHILTLIFSMISGGNKLQDVNRLGQDDALKRVLGMRPDIARDVVPASYCGALVTTSKSSSGTDWRSLRDATAAIQQDAFAMLPRERRKVATLDWDSSIHEVYGQKLEGADFAYRQAAQLQRVVRQPGGAPAMYPYLGVAGRLIGTPATESRKWCAGTIERVS